MNLFDVIMAGIGLSMDAIAISMTNGMLDPKMPKRRAVLIGFLFGLFQMLMPLIGYFTAKLVSGANEELFSSFSAWVAFVLLVFIGGKMIFDAWKEHREKQARTGCKSCGMREEDSAKTGAEELGEKAPELSFWKLVLQAIATSIDALALGISMRMTEMSSGLFPPIGYAAAIIGVLTFCLCVPGVYVGKKVGDKLSDKAELVGGIVLVLIGFKCLFF